MIENPRVRLALAEHGRRIALVLAVVAAALLVVAIWMVVGASGETVNQQTNQQTIQTELRTAATAGDPWNDTTRLEDHPAYLLEASPTVEVIAETDAPPGSTVTHTLSLRTVVERDEGVVWQNTSAATRETLTAENGTARTTMEVNVSEYRGDLATRQQEFAGVGSVRSRLVLQTEYDTGTYEGRLSTSPTLAVTDRAYWVDGSQTASAEEFQTETVQQDPQIDWSTVLVLVVLGGLAVAGAAGAATYRVEADLGALRQEIHRQRYDDWISDGSIPMGVGGEYVALDSLKDVVDVAIDTSQRVVYDRRRDVFAVITGDVVYYYSREGDWNQVAWPTAGETEAEESPSFLEAFGMADEESPAGLDAESPPGEEFDEEPEDAGESPFGGSPGEDGSTLGDASSPEFEPGDAGDAPFATDDEAADDGETADDDAPDADDDATERSYSVSDFSEDED